MKDEFENISVDSLKALQGSNGHKYEDHAAFVDKSNFNRSSLAEQVDARLGLSIRDGSSETTPESIVAGIAGKLP